jgi:hypothetical protein
LAASAHPHQYWYGQANRQDLADCLLSSARWKQGKTETQLKNCNVWIHVDGSARKHHVYEHGFLSPGKFCRACPWINFSILAFVQHVQLTAMLWIKMHHLSTGAVISMLPDLGRDAQHWVSRVHREVKKFRA